MEAERIPSTFVAQFRDAGGVPHRLEEWREGATHLRRQTDDRIDLHADAFKRPGQTAEYLWQVIDLRKKILHRVSTQGMLRAGMPYNFWSMAHVLTRPAGRFRLSRLVGGDVVHVGKVACTWYLLEPEAQPATRVCWSPVVAAPLRIDAQSRPGEWMTAFSLQTIGRSPILAAVFNVNPAGLQVREVDELAAED